MSNWQEYRKLALADLEKGLALDAKQPQALLLIAKLNCRARRRRQAGGSAWTRRSSLSADEPPLRAEALTLRADIRKDVKEQLADLDEAVRLLPDAAAAFRAAGGPRRRRPTRRRAGRPQPRLELEPKTPSGYQAKALVLAKMKKYDEALAALDKADRPGSPDTRRVRWWRRPASTASRGT